MSLHTPNSTPQLPALLPLSSQASLTHTSHWGAPRVVFEELAGSGERDYERLEFLGDAVLQLAVTELITTCYPDVTVGAATDIRGRLVCNAHLAQLCTLYGLQEKLLGSPISLRDLERTRAALFEAYLGGVRKEHGRDTAIDWTKELFLPLLQKAYLQVKALLDSPPVTMTNGADDKTPWSRLTEWCMAQGREIPATSFEEEGVANKKVFTCKTEVDGKIYTGMGTTKKAAKHNVATAIMTEIERINID